MTRRAQPESVAGWAMAGPSVALIGLFGLVPVLWSLWLSFQDNDLQSGGVWAGTANYRAALHDPVLREAAWHSVVYTAIFVPLTLLLSLLAAGALNRRVRGITVYRLAMFVPVVTSTIATGVIFSWLLDANFGLVNAGLRAVGLPTFRFFSSPHGALYAVVLMTTWGWVGFGTLIYLAGLQGVPTDVIEAARIDGCSRAQAFWRVQVPMLRPVTGFLLVWLTINALQLFDEVYATTRGGPLHATTVVVYYLYQQGFQFFRGGYAAAIAVLLFLVIAAITGVQLWLNRDPLPGSAR